MLAVASAGLRDISPTLMAAVSTARLDAELIETGRVLTERCKLGDRVALQVGNALDLPYPDQSFDVVWCQNVTMNIADKTGFLAGVYRVLKRGGLLTATEYSVGPGGDILFPVPWAYDASINFLEPADVNADAISYGRLPHSRVDELLMPHELD